MRRNPFSLKTAIPTDLQSQLRQWRGIAKVRLKWVKNRGLDHIIDRDTDLKAASLLKDAIKRSPTGFLTARSVADWQKPLGLTVPVLRFMRRFPTIFHEFPHSRYASLPCFGLTETAQALHSLEQRVHEENESDTVERLCRLLMMAKTRTLSYRALFALKWDMGLPDNFERVLVPKYPDWLRFVKAANGVSCLRLVQWREEFAASALQRSNEESVGGGGQYRSFERGAGGLAFPMSFPRGYGAQKKVRAWMEEFHKLPYTSPYEDSRHIAPESDLMEKRVVGVLHEVLSLTLHKKTKRNYIRGLREEFNLPHKFTRLFTRYPGIFYLSLKCKTTTVALREGYHRGKLVDPHPLTKVRDKFYYVMRTGLAFRGKGEGLIPKEEMLGGALSEGEEGEGEEEEEEEEEEEVEIDDECSEDFLDSEDSSDED